MSRMEKEQYDKHQELMSRQRKEKFYNELSYFELPVIIFATFAFIIGECCLALYLKLQEIRNHFRRPNNEK